MQAKINEDDDIDDGLVKYSEIYTRNCIAIKKRIF